MLYPWQFLWVSLARSPSSEEECHTDKRKTSSENVAKYSDFREGVWLTNWRKMMGLVVGKRDVRRDGRNGWKTTVKKCRKGKEVNKQTNNSAQPNPSLVLMLMLEKWTLYGKQSSPWVHHSGWSSISPGNYSPDPCEETSWQLWKLGVQTVWAHTHTPSFLLIYFITTCPSSLLKLTLSWRYLAAVPAYASHRVYWRWPSPGDINISGPLSTLAHGRTQAAQSPGGGAAGGTQQEGEG